MDNRRLGDRARPDDLSVQWVVPGTKVGARRESKRPPAARVLDISHSGLQVVAPADKQIQRGTTLEVVIRDVSTGVRVRWVELTNVQGVLAYGVEFVKAPPALREVVSQIIEETFRSQGIELRDQPPERRTIW